MNEALEIATPEWSLPLLEPCRYKGAKGGRGSGKSHFFAEALVEEHLINPDQRSVCVREIQKSLKFSAKQLIEDKIHSLGLTEYFEITQTEIRSTEGRGVIIFQGLQDHTADSIKSLEGFDRAWVEEAQSISKRSLELLLPTIRAPGSELWFSWNPDQPDDPVEKLFKGAEDRPEFCLVTVNYMDNPFCPQELIDEAERHRITSPETFDHVWLGGYNKRNKAQVLHGLWRVDEFDPGEDWGGPYFGMDFGFAQDPTAAVKCWVHNNVLYVEREAGKVQLKLSDTPGYMRAKIPGIEQHTIRCDNARPESIVDIADNGLPRAVAVKKWPGSVQDGVEHLRSYDEIVIHTRCKETTQEARLYSHKVDRLSGDILPAIVDDWNHYMDAIRYALGPLIRQRRAHKLVRG